MRRPRLSPPLAAAVLADLIADLEATAGMLRAVRGIDPPRSAEVDDGIRRLGDMAFELRGDAAAVLDELAAASSPCLSLVEHQPREQPVPCRGCGAMTWNTAAICDGCAKDGRISSWPVDLKVLRP